VHMQGIGSPILGDRVYGGFSGLPNRLQDACERFGRQALHAWKLGFRHPLSGKAVSFEAEMPADMKELLEVFRLEDGRG
jgi:23S rRNA pseudouridine1911/1915/1917 synthase